MPKGGDVGEAFGGDPAGGSGAVDGWGAAGVGETLVEGGPVTGLVGVDDGERQDYQAAEEVVEFVLVADVGPAFAADGIDGGVIELACLFEDAGGEAATERGGAGGAFFEAGFVRGGVGGGVWGVVGELGGGGGGGGGGAGGAR